MKKLFWHKKALLTLVLFILFGCERSAQNNQLNVFDKKYQDTFKELFEAEKYNETFTHLQLWENAEPDNPEMFVAYFNYYIARNTLSGVSIDEETEDIFAAIEYLDRGLELYPNRLDMHFGKIYILNETGHFKMAGDELFSTLEISEKINNNWAWADNGTIRNGEVFFISSIQDYYRSWLDAETEEAYDQVKLCAEKQIELYPGYLYSYNYLAVCYLTNGQFQEGLKYLLQAETIAPDDCTVLENIGRTYMSLNDNEKAEEYFRKILEIGDDQEQLYALYYLYQL